MQMNIAQMADNPNIRVFWPAGPDGKRSTFALPYYIGLVQGAPHADAGKKLIEFLLSKEAQSQVSAIAQGMPVRKDVHPTDDNFKKLHAMMEGVTIWTPDWAKVLKDLQADVARWHEVTGQLMAADTAVDGTQRAARRGSAVPAESCCQRHRLRGRDGRLSRHRRPR